MSSTIVHLRTLPRPIDMKQTAVLQPIGGGDPSADVEKERESRDPFLVGMGERVRLMRARRGLTRKALAKEADVSERYLANLESGVGNASVLFLRQLMKALNCTLAEIVGDATTLTPDWMRIRELLNGRDHDTLKRARIALEKMLATAPQDPHRLERIAVIGFWRGG